MTYSNEERQRALDWLKARIKPRLPYAKGRFRITEEQLDSITIDLEDKANKARINYLLQMVWRNWVCGDDAVVEWNYRFLPPNDSALIAMDDDCDCSDYHEDDPNYFEIYCKLYNDSEAIDNATVFIGCMEHDDVHAKLSSLENQILWYRWKYEPDTLTKAEKRHASLCGFDFRPEEDVKRWLTDNNYVEAFPGDSVEVEADDETEPLPM